MFNIKQIGRFQRAATGIGLPDTKGFCENPLRLLAGHPKLLLCPPAVPAGLFLESLGSMYLLRGMAGSPFHQQSAVVRVLERNISRAVLWCVSSAMYGANLTFLGLLSNFEWI